MISKILDQLYVGNCDWVDEDLQKLGVTHIVNVSGVNIKTKLTYTHLHLNDDQTNPPSSFSTINAVIEDEIRRGGKVLVCCRAGQSRSVAVVIYYLTRRGSNKLGAYEAVKSRHAIAQINPYLWGSI